MLKCKVCGTEFEKPLISNVPCEETAEPMNCCPECGVIEQFEEI